MPTFHGDERSDADLLPILTAKAWSRGDYVDDWKDAKGFAEALAAAMPDIERGIGTDVADFVFSLQYNACKDLIPVTSRLGESAHATATLFAVPIAGVPKDLHPSVADAGWFGPLASSFKAHGLAYEVGSVFLFPRLVPVRRLVSATPTDLARSFEEALTASVAAMRGGPLDAERVVEALPPDSSGAAREDGNFVLLGLSLKPSEVTDYMDCLARRAWVPRSGIDPDEADHDGRLDLWERAMRDVMAPSGMVPSLPRLPFMVGYDEAVHSVVAALLEERDTRGGRRRRREVEVRMDKRLRRRPCRLRVGRGRTVEDVVRPVPLPGGRHLHGLR